MRRFVLSLLLCSCHQAYTSSHHDAGVFKNIGDPCDPDVAPDSECGYPPQFFCSSAGVCASACNGDDDCVTGTCVGASTGTVGSCQLGSDGGT